MTDRFDADCQKHPKHASNTSQSRKKASNYQGKHVRKAAPASASASAAESQPVGENNPTSASAPARFSFVCESQDGRLCLFEDASGHFAIVRAERLA